MGSNYYLLSLPNIIGNMENKIRIMQQYIWTDFDKADEYLIIIELENDVPMATYMTKLPKPFTLFPLNLYIKN